MREAEAAQAQRQVAQHEATEALQREATASRRAAQRTRIGLIAALTLALLASGAGLYAFMQKQAAVAHANRADDARKLMEEAH